MSVYDRDREPPLFSDAPASTDAASTTSSRADTGRTVLWGGAMVLLALVVFGGGVATRFVTHDQSQSPSESAVQPAPPVETTEAATPTTAEQLPLEPKGGNETQSDYEAEVIQDWALACPADPAAGQCFIQQRLAGRDGETTFVWTIGRDQQGVVRAVWQTPADVDVRPGMAVDLGDGQPRTVPFEACDANSCSVRAVLAPVYLDALKRATTVSAVVMAASTGQITRYQFSTNGLAEALSRLE